MRRIMLTVAYDGTDFHGWQVQPGVRTVEGELNKCLSELLGSFRLECQYFRLLSCMLVLGSCINIKFLVHFSS